MSLCWTRTLLPCSPIRRRSTTRFAEWQVWISGLIRCPRTRRTAGLLTLAACLAGLAAAPATAQAPVASEVRQIVTFSFLPGRSAEALELYREAAIPLYREDEAMLSFRAFREVESPVPLDLVVVSSFEGMSGMDASNARLRELAAAAGTSIGEIYGEIGALSSGHTDEFVEMLPDLGGGDPSATRLTAFIRYRVAPGQGSAFEALLTEADGLVDAPSATGRFLLSDGWDYLQIFGFESLGDYQRYRARLRALPIFGRMERLVTRRQEIIVAGVPSLSVR